MNRRRRTKSAIGGSALLLVAPYLVGCGAEYQTVTVPAGTQVTVRLEETLSTQSNDPGDSFHATVMEPLFVGGKPVAPEGTLLRGELTELERPEQVDGPARMTLSFQEAEGPDGDFHAIPTQPITIEAEASTRDDLEKVTAGAVAGAIIGGLTKGGKGAAVGAVIGAGAGGLVVVATRDGDLTLEEGQPIRITLAEAVEIPVATPPRGRAEQTPDPNGEGS